MDEGAECDKMEKEMRRVWKKKQWNNGTMRKSWWEKKCRICNRKRSEIEKQREMPVLECVTKKKKSGYMNML